jgi:hypothetical protein
MLKVRTTAQGGDAMRPVMADPTGSRATVFASAAGRFPEHSLNGE